MLEFPRRKFVLEFISYVLVE